MKDIEKKLDCLVQEWACKQRSYISSQPATVGHHYHSRRIKLLRWDLHNIIPLTHEEHYKYHAGAMELYIRNPFREQYLENMKNKDFKQYLLENNLTEREFLLKKYKELKHEVSNEKSTESI